MTREFLKNLGLEDSVIDKILAENTQDVNQEKAQTTTAQTALADTQGKLTAASEELEKLKNAGGDGDAAGIKKQLSELQEKYKTDIAERDAKLADRDYSDAITRAISGRALKFSSKAAERDFIARVKEKKLELTDGELTGLDDFIKAQREADPDAFAPDKAPPRFITGGGGGHGAPGGGGTKTPAELMAEAIGKANAESGKAANDIISAYTGGKS